MEVFAAILLGVACLGIVFLFVIKNWEEKKARVFFPALRLLADEKALELKAFLVRCDQEVMKLGPTSLRVTRALLHELALTLAALSRASERRAHQLADMVSHKHRFERKETKSEFLKQVGEASVRSQHEIVAEEPVIEAVPEAVQDVVHVEAAAPEPVGEIKPIKAKRSRPKAVRQENTVPEGEVSGQ